MYIRRINQIQEFDLAKQCYSLNLALPFMHAWPRDACSGQIYTIIMCWNVSVCLYRYSSCSINQSNEWSLRICSHLVQLSSSEVQRSIKNWFRFPHACPPRVTNYSSNYRTYPTAISKPAKSITADLFCFTRISLLPPHYFKFALVLFNHRICRGREICEGRKIWRHLWWMALHSWNYLPSSSQENSLKPGG